MDLTWYVEKGIAIVAPHGEIDATNQDRVQQVVDHLLNDGHRRFIMDLNGVEFIDSSGLVMLVKSLKHIRGVKGDIYLSNIQTEVLCILKLTRLDRVFERFSDVPAALERFQNKS